MVAIPFRPIFPVATTEVGRGLPVEYKTTKTFQQEELRELFSSVGWGPVKNPDRLVIALQNSDTVVSVWDNSRLVGLANALSDGR